MSVPSASDAVQKDPASSTTTLALPTLVEVEKGFQTRSKVAGDSNQDAESRSPVEKEEAREDEEWLENPAHPRNWTPGKKWTDMAIVSEFSHRFSGPQA
jgi:hypothetical protein